MKQLQPKSKWPLHLLFRDKYEWLLWSWGWRRGGWGPELYQEATKHKGLSIKALGQKINQRHLLTNLHGSRNGWLTIALTTISTKVKRSLLLRYEVTDIVFLLQRVRRAEMPPCCHSGEKACRAFSRHMQRSLVSPLKGRGDRRAMHSTFPLKCYRWWLGGADTNYMRLRFTMGSILVYVYQPKTAVICHCGILGENGF